MFSLKLKRDCYFLEDWVSVAPFIRVEALLIHTSSSQTAYLNLQKAIVL